MHEIVRSLDLLPSQLRVSILERARAEVLRPQGPPMPPVQEHPLGPRRERKDKRGKGRAMDETVALAMKLGRITNSDICAMGKSHGGAKDRLDRAQRWLRIERCEHGAYEACQLEYQRIGL